MINTYVRSEPTAQRAPASSSVLLVGRWLSRWGFHARLPIHTYMSVDHVSYEPAPLEDPPVLQPRALTAQATQRTSLRKDKDKRFFIALIDHQHAWDRLAHLRGNTLK